MAAIALGGQGLLQIVPPAQLDRHQAQQAAQKAAAEQIAIPTGIVGHIINQYYIFKNHRNTGGSGWNERMLAALRAFNGVYDATKLQEIRQFGGSEVYAKLIAMKCRGASSLLRDVYLSPDKPWGLVPPDDPDIPPEIIKALSQLVQHEVQGAQQLGKTITPDQLRDRARDLLEQARQMLKKKARDQTRIAEDKLNEILSEGGFYEALAEFLVDLPLFPYAILKGPVVQVLPKVIWQGNQPTTQLVPKLCWKRVNPFDLWWTPGAENAEQCDFIERTRTTRAELNDCLDLDGYDHDEVRAVLDEYGRGGINDNWDTTDAERAIQENREDPFMNRSGMLSCLEYNGAVQGRLLLEYGMNPKEIPDEMRDYTVQAWMIGRHVIKAQLSPYVRRRHPYYITSYEKMPGTLVGNALPDILSDVQDVANATLRGLVNNLSMASGPQVVVNEDRLGAGENGNDLYPWKRWRVTTDPLGNNTQKPIEFFQPTSNSQELWMVFQNFSNLADDLSGIPKYLSGQGASSGAGRTASGLSMLMGNAGKIIQTVAANCDRDVIEPCISNLMDMVLMTDDTGLLTGEESVRVLGVQVAMQKETQRSRQLEFLQITANPLDVGIMGPQRRAKVLRSVSKTIGMDGEEIVPTDSELEAEAEAKASAPPPDPTAIAVEKGVQAGVQAAVQAITKELAELTLQRQIALATPGVNPGGPEAAAAQAQGAQSQMGPGSTATGDMGPRENLQQSLPKPSGGVH